jgi:hypothetical protein
MMANLEKLTIALTPELRAFVAQLAARESRSVASQVRHLVVEAHRRAGSPPSVPPSPVPVLPNVQPTPESIAEAWDRVAVMDREVAGLERKKLAGEESAAEEARRYQLKNETSLTKQRIVTAEQRMKSMTNGAEHG